ncbi:hypothetical protein EUTSA_v10017320mg [Eutrema salsugineum]|uniref:YABBY N-terminal domain-containing protein n=1 Tax=Eutrema salsugineum TaxID=72664 RepID=V4LKW3_EUTSA|nr:hypothetical protein EUTSA_v10017320mg [Eutrema salsugineum]
MKVSVPCSSLFDIVTVRCGHCTNLWSVNMVAALQSLSRPNFQATNYAMSEHGSSSRGHTKIPSRISTRTITEQRVVNRRKPLSPSRKAAASTFCLQSIHKRGNSEDQGE